MTARQQIGVAALMTSAVSCFAQPSGEELLRQADKAFSKIEDYSVELNITVDLDRIQVPERRATLYFKQPDKVHFESEGVTMVPREGIALNPGRLLNSFVVTDVKIHHASEGTQYILALEPKSENIRARRMTATLDSASLSITAIETRIGAERTMSVSMVYEDVQGFHMPSMVHVELSAEETESAEDSLPAPLARGGRSSRIPPKGTIAIRYSDYRINQGLSDEIFERKKEQTE